MKNLNLILALLAFVFMGLSNLANACNPFTPTISGPTVYCYGNCCATLDAGVYTSYLWSTGETTQTISAQAGILSVTVTDNQGCTGTNSVTVTEDNFYTAAQVGALTSTQIEQGDSVELYAYNLEPHSIIHWFDYLGPTADTIWIDPGLWNNTLIIEVTDSNGCLAWNEPGIGTLETEFNPYFTLYPDTNQLHHYFLNCQFIGMAPYDGYDWDWGDGSQHDTIPSPTHSYSNAGFYTICLNLTDSYPASGYYCDSSFHIMRTTNTIGSITVINPNITTGIKENSSSSLTIFPNPASQTITINSQLSIINCQLTITDIMGNKIMEQSLNTVNTTLDVSKYAKGIYTLQIRNDRESFVKKIVID